MLLYFTDELSESFLLAQQVNGEERKVLQMKFETSTSKTSSVALRDIVTIRVNTSARSLTREE